MPYKQLIVALSMMVTTSPISATQSEQIHGPGAPKAPATARFCLRVDPVTGSRMETIRCETREGWTQLGIDVDEEWTKWGIRVIASKPQDK